MLWLALRLPRLVLEVLSRGRAPFESDRVPWAIADAGRVLACDAQAEALGVRPGIGLAAAWALASQLRVWPSNPAAENEALQGVAAWMCRFTPRVSLQAPDGVLAEIEGSLRLFHGLSAILEQVRAGIEQMGLTPVLAVAPTAQGAWWLASAGRETMVLDLASLEMALAMLPVGVACDRSDAISSLHNIGVRTIGELHSLPREGVAQRFGQALLDRLEQALGRTPEPRKFFAPPTHFTAKLEFPGEVTHSEEVLFAARRLLVQLEGLLASRQAAVRRFVLILLHGSENPTVLNIGLASPGREAERFVQLLRERLAACRLARPIAAIRIEVKNFVYVPKKTVDIFDDSRVEDEAWDRLLERLRARLGGETVHCVDLSFDHRPERAWRALAIGERPLRGDGNVRVRPLWLVDPPCRLKDEEGVPHNGGPLELLAGPERIESGWWDDEEIARDYFIARRSNAALLWIFRERGMGGGWYLHGVFA